MMIKLESVLQRQLAPIIERRELIHRRRVLTLVFAITAVLALIAWRSARGAEDASAALLLLPIGGGILAALAARIFFRPRPVDLRQIAREIESNNPELNALLLTAVEQDGGDLGFLQERVVHDAAREAITAQWGETVATGESRGWRIGQAAAAVAMGFACAALLGSVAKRGSDGGSGERSIAEAKKGGGRDWQLEVTPGDVEVERDSKLLVTARFGERVPGAADLEVVLGETGRTIPTRQSLTDPIFSRLDPRGQCGRHLPDRVRRGAQPGVLHQDLCAATGREHRRRGRAAAGDRSENSDDRGHAPRDGDGGLHLAPYFAC